MPTCQVCLKSCHLKPLGSPAALIAKRQVCVAVCVTGCPWYGNTHLSCLLACSLSINTASFDNGTPIAFSALAWSGCIQAIRFSRLTWDHSRCVTLWRRKPVSSAKRIMNCWCFGRQPNKVSAWARVIQLIRFTGSLSVGILGQDTIHSQSSLALRKMARIISKVRLMVLGFGSISLAGPFFVGFDKVLDAQS